MFRVISVADRFVNVSDSLRVGQRGLGAEHGQRPDRAHPAQNDGDAILPTKLGNGSPHNLPVTVMLDAPSANCIGPPRNGPDSRSFAAEENGDSAFNCG